ncbi:hypothetical protein PVK06_027242 [Gossypium arboreum]|uniref:Reverse transcriptase domain-containing protein n=1 Tax=Gossypium arboreum TaxID=29729 RepID=A0ABR0P023_GOSAR|nr:hypothetical protein PVK06_027242 [Gossypium arboreum]
MRPPVLNDEINKELFDMAPEVMGSMRIFSKVSGILLEGRFVSGFRESLLDRPKDFSQFRPISLCSITYKLVMKVIANRFKVVFPNYISPEQAGFIIGRNISDNVIIVQEVIHSMCSRKDGRNWMAIKLDLEKTYDRISWDFIDMSLVAAGIPEFLRKGILFILKSQLLGGIRFGYLGPGRPYLISFLLMILSFLVKRR